MVSKQTKHLFITLIVIIIISFIAGVLVGFNMQGKEETGIQRIIKQAELNTESYLIEQEMIEVSGKEQCSLTSQRISGLNEEIASIGIRLNEEGAEKSLGSENFNFLKRKYYIMQIKNYLFYKKLLESCEVDTNILLYYYSPSEEFDIGPLLAELASKRDIRIFPIEFGFSEEIEFIEVYYDIKETPVVIINYKDKLEGKDSITEENILELLRSTENVLS